jgi:hypothetical protein
MGYRWKGFEHPVLHKMINDGPGAAASDPQTIYWQGLTDELTLVDEELNAKLKTMKVTWEGQAADSAQSGLTPLAAWASDAETGSTVMRISSEDQGEYISDARAKMPEPIEVTTQAPSGWQIATAGAAVLTGNPGPALDVAKQAADHEAQEAAQSEAEQRAVETMDTYDSSSTANRETLGTFVPPPDVVVATPEPRGGTPGHVTGTTTLVNNVGANGTETTSASYSPSGTGGSTSVTPVGSGGSSWQPSTPPPGGSAVPPVTTPSGGGPFPPPTGNPLPPGGNPPPYQPPSPNPGYPPPTPLPSWSNNNQVNTKNPYSTRSGLPAGPGGGGNSQDVVRRGTPAGPGVRGGVPGGGLPGGGVFDAERSSSQLGRGGLAGAGVPGEGGVVRNAPGAAGAAGRGGSGVNGPVGPGGRRDGEEDEERFAPDYLLETEDVFGDGDQRVVPTVIGE